MDLQQITAIGLAALSAAYLGRNGVRAYRALRETRSGCGSGCGKCAFAAQPDGNPKPAPRNVIALADLRATAPRRTASDE